MRIDSEKARVLWIAIDKYAELSDKTAKAEHEFILNTQDEETERRFGETMTAECRQSKAVRTALSQAVPQDEEMRFELLGLVWDYAQFPDSRPSLSKALIEILGNKPE